MKYFYAIACSMLLSTTNLSFSQIKTNTHKVEKGETVTQIAQKYLVTPYDIYQLNPDAQSGLKVGTVLLIPQKSGGAPQEVSSVPLNKPTTSTSIATSGNGVTHQVLPKETLYGIEKKYKVSDKELKKANPFLETDGLQIGQLLNIPVQNKRGTDKKVVNESYQSSTTVSNEAYVYHDVLPKETKYSISRKYGMSIAELEKRNPEIASGLPIGFRLTIKGNAPKGNLPVAVSPTVAAPYSAKSIVPSKEYELYEVKPKETLYSLSKMTNLSQDELIELNPQLKEGVSIGMILKVPAEEKPALQQIKPYTSLDKVIEDGKRKRMVMLLPFNVSDVQNDTTSSSYNRLKTDKFLNMTLDFYAGALIAIDSAKALGFPIDIEIYDSEETKNNSSVRALVRTKRLETANAIVGPFYQSNAEVMAQLVSDTNVPVISPLSKDVGNSYPNLYQTIPSNEIVKNTMFEFMRKHNGNIMAVVDKKKVSVLQYLKQYQSNVPLVDFTSNGNVSSESLKSLLVKGKMNYVVMETANTWMIKTVVAAMIGAMPEYNVQLVILEPNDTLNFEEIKFTNLTKLKLMYPSVTRDNSTPGTTIFDKDFKAVNGVYPSDYATRGFDVTFDTMLRLLQNVKFETTVNEASTEHVENKFAYFPKSDGGYTNRGVFIMYYDTDLTIKEAK